MNAPLVFKIVDRRNNNKEIRAAILSWRPERAVKNPADSSVEHASLLLLVDRWVVVRVGIRVLGLGLGLGLG